MAIVRARMPTLHERYVERNFRADQHGAVTLYYADCLRKLYTRVSDLKRTKSARTPETTPEARRTVLGFPEKNTPDCERTEVRAWCRRQLNEAQPGEDSEMTRSMRAYLANPHNSTSQAAPSQAADPSPVRERREADFNKAQRATAELAGQAARASRERPLAREAQAQARAELSERTAACACYCRGEIPRFHRNFSPLGDLDYIRRMPPTEQAGLSAQGISIGTLISATEAEWQARERAEVQKYTEQGETPPWHRSLTGMHPQVRLGTPRAPKEPTETEDQMRRRLFGSLGAVLDEHFIWQSIRREVFVALGWESDFEPTQEADLDEYATRITAAVQVHTAVQAGIDPRDVTPDMTRDIRKEVCRRCTWFRKPTRAASETVETGASTESERRGPTEPTEQRDREEPSGSFRIPTSNRFSALEEEEHREEEGDGQAERPRCRQDREEEGEDQAERPRCRLCEGEGHTADQCPDMLTYARAAEDAQQPGASEEPTIRRLQPQFPIPREGTRTTADSLAVLDDLSWDEVIAPNPFPTIKNVPSHVQGQLLDTMRQALQHVSDAAIGPNANELEFERWSKLYFKFPTLFLRIPPRGGRKGANMIESRLDAYRRGDFASLLKWYRYDQEAALQAPRGRRQETREQKLKRVLAHTRVGQFTKAMRKITSSGIGDSRDPAIRAQLSKKFPDRKFPVGPLSDYTAGHTNLGTGLNAEQITAAIRRMAPGTAPGPDGWQGDWLKMMLLAHNKDTGECVIAELARLGTIYVQGKMPKWFYYISSGALLVPVIKSQATTLGGTPDCRPVSVGSVMERMFSGAALHKHSSQLLNVYEPQQLGFTQNGVELLPLMVRTQLDLYPNHCCVKMDKENHFGEVSRDAAMQVCAATPELGPILPMLHALHAEGSPLFYDDGTRANDIVEGAKQGSPASAHLSAIALQPLLKKYDERMQKHGGFVRSIADDVYLVGPPSAVAEVYPDYKEDLKGIGSRLNEPKNAVLLGPECELPAEFPIRRGAIYDGPMGKSGNLVGYGIVCVGVPIGDASFIRRYLELKETDVIEKFDRTMELLGPTSKFTAFRLTQQCLAPQVDFLGRTLDPSANTAGFFSRFDRKVQDTVAECTSQGREWPRGDTPHLSEASWALISEKIALPKRLGGWGYRRRGDMNIIGAVAGTIDCVNLGLGKPGTPAASTPLFPPSILSRMTPHPDPRMRLQSFLDLGTERGAAFERAWEWCQQKADEGTQMDPTLIETPLNWPAGGAGNSADGKPLTKVQKAIGGLIAKVEAAQLDRNIRALDPSNPVQMAWMNSDLHSNSFAAVIPTEMYNFTNDEFAIVAATNAGMPNPACLRHLGFSLVRPKAGDETAGDEDGADPPPGSTVDAFGFNISSRVQTGGAWTTRHSRFLCYIALLMQMHGIRVRVEPRNLINRFIPRTFRPDLADDETKRTIQGAIPDIVYDDPKDDKQRVVELKFHNQCKTRYPRGIPTGRCAGVREREQMLHQDYLNRLRKLDRKVNQTPAGTVGPLERGFSEITNASDFKGWVVGFYGEQSKALAGVANMIADAQTAKWQARYGREPTDQQRAWLVNKVRTDIAMKATKLNAQVQLTNLQAMYERGKATSDQRRQLELEYQDWARLQGRGPHTAGGHGRNRHVGWQEQ